MEARLAEIKQKERMLRKWMDARRIQAVALSLQSSFAWATAGGDSKIGMATEMGCATLIITGSSEKSGGSYLLVNNIEAQRLQAEQLPPGHYIPLIYPWYQPDQAEQRIKELAGSGSLAGDTPLYQAQAVLPELARLRYALHPSEQERYRIIGADAAQVARCTLQEIQTGQSEYEMAAIAAHHMLDTELQPALILVAADERIAQYRHPLPTENRLKRAVLLVICARRWGLIASVSRLAHFGTLPDDMARRHRAVCRVDAELISRTRAGAEVKEIFQAAQQVYGQTGFPDEWKLHHQGGATGYTSRDYKGSPDSSEVVLMGQAFAWNPSIAGTKSEDTVLVTNAMPEILTADPDWPMITVETVRGSINRPDILIR